MKDPRLNRVSILLAGLLLVSGCASREMNLASLEPDELYERGTAAYAGGDYDRAIRILDTFVARNLGDPRAPEARMLLGRAHLAQREFVSAATHFQRLVSDYPSSPLQQEARSAICDSYYRLSPGEALDQEYTHAAIDHCEAVVAYYPGTPDAETAAHHVADLRTKLARKAYETGVFYFRRRAYDAAVVYFTGVVQDYPDTSVAPAALQQLVETYTRIGYVEEATEARERLIREYPDSPEAQAVRA